MIDIHAHILPGLDDGPEDLSTALAMAQRAEEEGIKKIIATPHMIPGESLTLHKILKAVEDFNKELRRNNILIEVLPGAEVYLDLGIADKLRDFPTLNNGCKYLLVELPMSSFPQYTEQILFQLKLKGITPILAHPERNLEILRKPELLHKLVSKGILAQINAASLTGEFGKQRAKSAKLFLKHNLVHFIATDCHSLGVRAPKLRAALRVATQIVGVAKVNQLVQENPLKVIVGEDLLLENLSPFKLEQKLWTRWKSIFSNPSERDAALEYPLTRRRGQQDLTNY